MGDTTREAPAEHSLEYALGQRAANKVLTIADRRFELRKPSIGEKLKLNRARMRLKNAQFQGNAHLVRTQKFLIEAAESASDDVFAAVDTLEAKLQSEVEVVETAQINAIRDVCHVYAELLNTRITQGDPVDVDFLLEHLTFPELEELQIYLEHLAPKDPASAT